ncbi:MAG: leucyl aminopeptidase family protein [Candidatus Micrarchaeota archaeon]|nr:leucyl aminopeptidase family protein [Candidatus Micrarchaeota archaeon]MCX8154779.1 leucyl aminopeptidase family protein [Candidatus Micrarchaeota archaeon]
MKIIPKRGGYRLTIKKGSRDTYRIEDSKQKVIIFYKDRKPKGLRLAKTVFSIMRDIDAIYVPKTLYSKHILYGVALADRDFSMKSEKEERKEKELYTNMDRDVVELDRIMIESEIYARSIANTPSNIATPEWMLERAKELANEYRLDLEIIDRSKLSELGMNMFLAVNQGSNKGGYIGILKYIPKSPKAKVVLVGKGLCFDTGGLSMKPPKHMYTMHMDKSGAAVVLGVMKGVAELKPNVEVWGVLALTENSVDANSTHPGSVVRAYNGKTVEIVHTDAEGRLVLGDTVAYLYKNYKFDYLITIATLTGAANIALGRYATALLSNNDELVRRLIRAGEEEEEKLWRLPLYPEYNELIKSSIADIKNIGGWEGEAGTIIGAKFIENFVDGKNWAHLDIAARMIDHEFHRDVARAPNTRTLIRFLLDLNKSSKKK